MIYKLQKMKVKLAFEVWETVMGAVLPKSYVNVVKETVNEIWDIYPKKDSGK